MRVLRGWLPLRRKFPATTTSCDDDERLPSLTSRLHIAILGGVLIPIGLFWFAWCAPQGLFFVSNSFVVARSISPSIHWIVPILAGVPFGAGVAQILQSLTTYLMDTYPLYFASSVASTIVLRSCCGALFPLFSPAMFRSLGDQWAMSLFGFLALACMPIPVLFWVSHGCSSSVVRGFSYLDSGSEIWLMD